MTDTALSNITRIEDAYFDADGRAIAFDARWQGTPRVLTIDARRLIWAERGSHASVTRLKLAGAGHDLEIVAPYEQVKALMIGGPAFSAWNREHR